MAFQKVTGYPHLLAPICQAKILPLRSLIHPLKKCCTTIQLSTLCTTAYQLGCLCVCVCVFVCVILVYGEDSHKEEKWIFLITLKGASYRDVELF